MIGARHVNVLGLAAAGLPGGQVVAGLAFEFSRFILALTHQNGWPVVG